MNLLTTELRLLGKTIAAVALLALAVAATPAMAAPDSLIGVWTFVSDSGGGTADTGTAITMTFGPGTVAFLAAGPGENLSGSGTWSANGNRITIQLPSIGKSAVNQPYTQIGNSLTLPFQVFSDAAGTSTWYRVTTPSNGGDTNNPPNPNPPGPNPPNPPNPPSPPNPPNPPTPPNPPNPPTPPNPPNPPIPPIPPNPQPSINPAIAPWVGDWVGDGWSWETRFRQSQKDFVNGLLGGHADALGQRDNIQGNVMEVMVEHETTYEFTVDTSGNITGEGEITYSVSPNLCGVAVLTAQVNEAVSRLAWITKIYKIANDIGTGLIQTYNQEFYASENELAEEVKTLSKSAQNVNPADKQEITRDVAKTFEDMGQSEDARALAFAEIVSRCAGGPGYQVVGKIPCDIVNSPAVETEIKSAVKEIGKTAGELLQDAYWDKVQDKAKEAMEKLNGVEIEEDDGCAKIGPSSAEEYKEQMEDKFKEMYADYAKGIGSASAMAAIASIGPDMVEKAANAALEAADPQKMVEMMLSIPGVTQVEYYYKGLQNGPEHRRYKIKGHVEPSGNQAKIYLSMDGDVTDGSKNLTIEYMVNYKKDTGSFPTWSPFLDKPGTAELSGTATIPGQSIGEGSEEGDEGLPTRETVSSPFVTFHEEGTHRNGVTPWQEYEYFWYAHQVTQLAPAAAGK